MPWYRFPNIGMVHMRGRNMPLACAAVTGYLASTKPVPTFELNGVPWNPPAKAEPIRKAICMGISAFLCDWPTGGGRTCDQPLCEAHAHQVGKNRHYCPEHQRDHLDQQGQRGLFTSLVQP